MRNLGSFEYLNKHDVLQRILDTYDKDSPEYYMLEEYIEYAKEFIRKVIAYCKEHHKTSITKEELAKIRNPKNELNNMFEDDVEKEKEETHTK